jgi:hypothetical protein
MIVDNYIADGPFMQGSSVLNFERGNDAEGSFMTKLDGPKERVPLPNGSCHHTPLR